eukprot:9895930-Heterocapsa_arctica.AAC.1
MILTVVVRAAIVCGIAARSRCWWVASWEAFPLGPCHADILRDEGPPHLGLLLRTVLAAITA